jgi:cell division protein FtsW (lipid II flippase)
VHFGSLSFQPIEFSKILLCIYFASYFAENKEMLTIPTAQIGNRLFLDPRPLIPILVAWGAAMAIIGLEDDIGFAALLFVLFIGLLWVATGRVGYLVLGLVLFGVGAYIAARYFGQVHFRVEQWQNPWPSTAKPGLTQIAAAQYGLGTGGVGGTGLGFDHYAGFIPELTSDMIFAAIGTEMGLIGGAAVVVAFVLLVGAGFRVAQTARSDFSRLMATGLVLILGFQAFFIMAGVVRLLPFTGITLPFVAYGGSSLLANYVLIALLLRISDEGAVAQAAMQAAGAAAGPGESPMVPAR